MSDVVGTTKPNAEQIYNLIRRFQDDHDIDVTACVVVHEKTIVDGGEKRWHDDNGNQIYREGRSYAVQVSGPVSQMERIEAMWHDGHDAIGVLDRTLDTSGGDKQANVYIGRKEQVEECDHTE